MGEKVLPAQLHSVDLLLVLIHLGHAVGHRRPVGGGVSISALTFSGGTGQEFRYDML